VVIDDKFLENMRLALYMDKDSSVRGNETLFFKNKFNKCMYLMNIKKSDIDTYNLIVCTPFHEIIVCIVYHKCGKSKVSAIQCEDVSTDKKYCITYPRDYYVEIIQ